MEPRRTADRDSPPEEPSRRTVLRCLGAAGVGTLAGCSSVTDDDETTSERSTTPNDTTTTRADPTTTESESGPTGVDESRFDSVVNVATEGADRFGETPINSVLEATLADDTLVYFPPGEYRVDKWRQTGYRNLGIVGDDATLVPPDGEQNYWLAWGDLRDFLFEGFTIDSTGDGVAPVNYLDVSGGSNVVRDVALRGYRTVPRSAFEVAVTDRDAELLIEDVRLPDGGIGGSGIYTFPKSVGNLTVKDCRIAHWGEGLYGSPHSGPLTVKGGYYANNGIAQVRVGGGTNDTLVEGVTVRADDAKDPKHKQNMRGIWMEEGENARISNCDVAITNLEGTYSSGGIVVGRQFGAATIEDTKIRIDARGETPGIIARTPIESMEGETMPSMDRLPREWNVTCENVRITGRVSKGTAIVATDRDDCLLEGVCIQHSEGDRAGVEVGHSKGCEVRDSVIDVPGDTIRTVDAEVASEAIRTTGDCR